MKETAHVAIGRKGTFSLDQAQHILPIIQQVTRKSSSEVDQLINRLEALGSSSSELIIELEAEINDLIKQWHGKIRRLGGLPKGLWLVDFDSGDGYYCWKYPEPIVMYWHNYTEGFASRVLIEERSDSPPAKNKVLSNP